MPQVFCVMNSPAAWCYVTCQSWFLSWIHRLNRVRESLSLFARSRMKRQRAVEAMSEDARSLDSQLDPMLIQQALGLLQPAQSIALLAHEVPSANCIGSALGMAHILRLLGKTCVPACAHAAPRNLSFLPGIETLQQTLGDESFDLVIVLDTGELKRLGRLYEEHPAFLANALIIHIDHHISSSGCGEVNIIDPKAATTSELLLLFPHPAGLPLDRDAALGFLTGLIISPTSFQCPTTTPRFLA